MENLQKDFLPYELAFRMKELGFDEPCLAFYKLENSELWYDTILQSKEVKFRNNTELNIYGDLKGKISAPIFSQAFRWFREKYSYQSFISPSNELTYLAYDFTLKGFGGYFKSKQFKTYEEAELACLEKLLEIVEEKQK